MLCIRTRNITPAAGAAVTASILVVPLRVWSLIINPTLQIYALFPAWLQIVVLATFAAQGAAACVSGKAARRIAGACAIVSLATAAVQGVAAFAAGAWLWWACMFVVQSIIYFIANE